VTRTVPPRLVPPAPRAGPWVLLCLLAGPWAAPAHGAPAAEFVPGADSVLAWVRGDSPVEVRAVTRTRFASAWARLQPPMRPDSLTPSGARRFLDLLVDREALGLMALAARTPWTAGEQAGYDALRDQLALGAALDSALAATRLALGAAADSLDEQTLGITARERAASRLAVTWDDSLVARLVGAFAALPRPTADSSAAAQVRMLAALPAVAPADTGRVLARSAVGGYRVADLLGAWGRLNPIYRPRVATAGDVRDLVTNGLFERLLRDDAARRDLATLPSVAARLAAERERIAVAHLVESEVYARVPTDSLTLLRFFRAHEREWRLPDRVRCLDLVLEDRAEAGRMAARLRDGAEADSLAARAGRAGSRWLRDVRADRDSTRFARLVRAGTGTVLGPEETPEGWEVTRVLAVLPGRGQSLAECRAQVLQRWYDEEGGRRMQDLLARARRRVHVEVRRAALEQLVGAPPPALRPAPTAR
jgi:hypothetical protein